MGRRGRNRSVAVYDFTRESAGVTRVELTTFSEPATKVDRFREIGAAGWIRRKTRKSLDRLRMIFEEPQKGRRSGPRSRATNAEKAARFGAHSRHGPGPPAGALRAGANMPARMPRRLLMLLCLAALAAGPAACGNSDVEQGVDEPAREGLALELDGVDYNVFITRQLNTKITPDNAYFDGPEAAKGETLYGVFIQVCNHSKDTHQTADGLQDQGQPGQRVRAGGARRGQRSSRTSLGELAPDECIPEAGSVAQLGPSAGSMLLFRLPLQNTEYRPLELEIEGPDGGHLTFELDI